jgi:uncharacterized protein
MIFNVAGLLKEPSGAVRKVRLINESVSSDPHGAYEEISGTITLMRTDRTVIATGELTGSCTRECSRCLEPARLLLQAEIEEEFQPVNTDVGGVQRKLPQDDDPLDPVLWIDDRNDLDLSGVVLQSFASMQPIAPLCRSDCRGLCPRCWKDRNKVDCLCGESAASAGWNGLASLTGNKANSAG